MILSLSNLRFISDGILAFQYLLSIGDVNNIPTMQFFIGISRNTQPKSYMLSLTEGVWEFQNNACLVGTIPNLQPTNM